MDSASIVSVTRQSGLKNELRIIANNIANAATTGFRREGMAFSEYVAQMEDQTGLSMARGNVRVMSADEGPLNHTGGTLDFAIQGEGYFQIETPDGPALSRAGSFLSGPAGEMMTPDGLRVLDEGGAPIFVPPDARNLRLTEDGTLSANGQAIARIGVVLPLDPTTLQHLGGALFSTAEGVEAIENPVILQGFVEGSNVDPIAEMARLIEVQHAYEAGQKFLDTEDERIRNVVSTLGR